MSGRTAPRLTAKAVRSVLAERLTTRRQEIEDTIFMRAREETVDAPGDQDVQYLDRLRTTVSALVGFAITSIEDGDECVTPVPSSVIEQARLAARRGITLWTVTRRYISGYHALLDFVLAEANDLPSNAVSQVMRPVKSTLDRSMEQAAAAYQDEAARLQRSPGRRRTQHLERLLARETDDTEELGYEFDRCWHIAVIANGQEATEAVTFLARALDRHGLPLVRDDDTVWAWLGGSRRISTSEIEQAFKESPVRDVMFAVGEPQVNLDGWRLTHQQAQSALAVAQRRPQQLTRYFDVAIDAALLQDEPLARQLLCVYLGCLRADDEDYALLRQTLRAYLAAGQVGKRAADALGIDRHTVKDRLRRAKTLLGYDLAQRSGELALALRISELLDAHPETESTTKQGVR